MHLPIRVRTISRLSISCSTRSQSCRPSCTATAQRVRLTSVTVGELGCVLCGPSVCGNSTVTGDGSNGGCDYKYITRGERAVKRAARIFGAITGRTSVAHRRRVRCGVI